MTGRPESAFPTVPDDRVPDGWAVTDQSSETVFELSTPNVSVRGHTVVYEDADLRAAVRDATDGELDRIWRFCFATRLEFSPPLPPGIGPMAVFSTVASRADDQFVSNLRERGFRDVSRGRRERIRVDSGDRARLRKYGASHDVTLPEGSTRTIPVGAFLAVWTTDGEFLLAGGAYPETPLSTVLEGDAAALDRGEDRFREDLLDLVRAVR